MYFLTFDTSLDKTYVTLFSESSALTSKIIESTEDKYHSAFLISTIAEILKNNSLTMSDIKAIGVNIGPGSFTGIRACITVARVIAQQLNLPLVGVSSLEILSKINSSEQPSLVMMDARKGMCYLAEFDKEGNTIQSPHLEPLESLSVSSKTHFIITDETMYHFLAEREITSTCYTDTNEDLGVFLGQITYRKLNSTEENNWAAVKPLYLQAPSITLPKKSLI